MSIFSQKPLFLDQRLTRQTLLSYFQNSWQLNDLLFQSIVDEKAFYTNPDPLRNPLIFYLGHPAVFYINKFKQVGLIQDSLNADYEHLFEIGVDPETPADLPKHDNWPGVKEVWAYRQTAYDFICELINRSTLVNLLPITWDHPLWALMMGLEHDRIHFETSSMLFRQLNTSLLHKPKDWEYAPQNVTQPMNKFIEVEAGSVKLGKAENFPTYGWDNEYGHLEVDVQPFAASQALISNEEFFKFVEDGGYQRDEFWTAEGLAWKNSYQVQHPKFWLPAEHYQYRTVFENIAMPWDWPAEVNYHEAAAYCNWSGKGARLLTEAEFNLIGQTETEDCVFTDKYNLNLKYGSPQPVNGLESSKTPHGFYDPYGNVWQWLSDDFYALPGFRTHNLYKDFSIPFFDSKHSMMLGGSWASTGTGASRFYRLWFRRHFYQHAGFRIAKSLN